MFEKEAYEYGKEKIDLATSMMNPQIETATRQGYKDGAEFGYNKANEWHKDLPTEDIRLAIIEIEDCGYLLCNYRNGFWYDENSGAICAEWITNNIVRWKEIVFPKEIKEND